MFAKYFTKKVINGKTPWMLILLVNLIAKKRNILLRKRGEFKGLINKEGLIEYNIDSSRFDPNNKKNGISLFARLKNAQDFLEIVVESHIPFYDEIVLVDNNSIDKTKEICLKLKNKYPEKILFYEYKPDVYGLGHLKWSETSENSVNCLSYYYNWALSKTNFKYVSKLDDDVVVMNPDTVKRYTNYIKNNGIDYLQIIPQLNVNNINGKLMTPIKGLSNIFPLIAGLYCDHGIFPISKKTYFIKDKIMESFIFPFGIKVGKLGFFHLKGLKKSLGAHNQHGKMADLIKKTNDGSIYIDLPKKYLDFLKSKINIKDYL